MRVALALFLLLSVTACGRLSLLRESPEPTLADLTPAELPADQDELPVLSLPDVAQTYREVLEVTDDPATRLQVEHRLADLVMLEGEGNLAVSDGQSEALQPAIVAYESLLRQHPVNPRNDQILYQLSRAYELNGDPAAAAATLQRLSQAHPDSTHRIEAEFRQAESDYAAGDYAAAERAYLNVTAAGATTPFYTNALYMQGWARYKQSDFDAAVASFTAALDTLVPADNDLSQLSRGDRELTEDSLRVMAVVFSSGQGSQSIEHSYADLGLRSYHSLVYDALGALYLSQERYGDSAKTYQDYIQNYPDSSVAHVFQLRAIEAFEAGGFPQRVIDGKRDYVAAFAVDGDYWLASDEAARSQMGASLRQYIDELARYHHALAQAQPQAEPETDSGSEQDAAARQANYQAAGDYYQQYIVSFPDDPDVPELGFLLAETRWESGDYAAAIVAYEWVAYDFSNYERAADAGYAAILAYDQLAPETPLVAHQRINSELAFAATFPADTRVNSVLLDAAQALLTQREYNSAIETASRLLQPERAATVTVAASAQRIVGHSFFELAQYDVAEQAYQEALAGMDVNDANFAATSDRLATSVYRQAEASAASGDSRTAAVQFARIITLAPNSPVRAAAQFDAAEHYAQAGDFEQANRLLIDFRERFEDHPLQEFVPAKLVANYEQLEQWGLAAAELDSVVAAVSEPQEQRQALYLAAQYYERSGDNGLAIARYRSYAHQWTQPLAPRMEAMERLATLYGAQNDTQRQAYWLQTIVATHDAAGAQQSQRSVYLAAESSNALAGRAQQRYLAIALQPPLKVSLAKKRQAMQAALGHYQQTVDYGVQEFTTRATYRMAQIYAQLSLDLMASPRPPQLDALALEQYELLLEEQAFPFEEQAIAIHEANVQRSWQGVYDEGVKQSFAALADLMPSRYAKSEVLPEVTPAELKDALRHDQSGDSEKAAEAFSRYVEDNPEDTSGLLHYAVFLRQQGQFEAAESVYLEALQISQLPDVHRNVGILYDLYLGNAEAALFHYQYCQQLGAEQDRQLAGWIVDLERRQPAVARGGS
tara:strand:- start:119897 stop:123067 length:3171 start_codon:yes stop_codon:yes gene_type:complete